MKILYTVRHAFCASSMNIRTVFHTLGLRMRLIKVLTQIKFILAWFKFGMFSLSQFLHAKIFITRAVFVGRVDIFSLCIIDYHCRVFSLGKYRRISTWKLVRRNFFHIFNSLLFNFIRKRKDSIIDLSNFGQSKNRPPAWISTMLLALFIYNRCESLNNG